MLVSIPTYRAMVDRRGEVEPWQRAVKACIQEIRAAQLRVKRDRGE
jgi:hypothetical protein